MTPPTRSSLPEISVNNWLAAGSDADALVLSAGAPSLLAEAFVQSKHNRQASEDVLVVTPEYLAVIDGMSSPLRSYGQRRTGRAFAHRAAEAIAMLPAEVDARTAVDAITEALSRFRARHSGPSGAVAAIFSLSRCEVWRVGDIHVSIGAKTLPASKDVDVALEWFRAAVDAALLAEGWAEGRLIAEDPGLAAAKPLLEAQPALANHVGPFGYGVLNGLHVPDQHLEVYTVRPGETVVLASDGFLGADSSLDLAQSRLAAAVAQDRVGLTLTRSMAKPSRPGYRAPDDRAYIRTHPIPTQAATKEPT